MFKPFQQHTKNHYAERPSWNRQATINGRPAWQVVEERKREKQKEMENDGN